ncbi:MAG: replication initiation factor domain-containing protein [Sedimentisphaerales bacterium]|nr:replication initiation factor domain-containing protein [Sedimentisphaerales bacterium]
MLEYLDMFFGEDREHFDWGALPKYDRSIRWPNAASLNYHSTQERADRLTAGGMTLELPGGAVESLDIEVFHSFAKGLSGFGFACARIDVFFDDFERLISPRELYPAVYEVDLLGEELRREFTGFLTLAPEQKYGGRRARALGGKRGLTSDVLRFGNRGSAGSGKSLRVYDKRLETQGERDCVRWELELCRHRSLKAYAALLNTTLADWPKVIGMMIGGCIDFRHRPVNADGRLLKPGDKNWSRLIRFDWWQRIIDKLGRLPIQNPVSTKAVERSAEWLAHQVSGTLQMLTCAYGSAKVLADIMDIVGRRDRLNAAHMAALAEFEQRCAGRPIPDIHEVRHWADGVGIEIETDPEDPPDATDL